MHIWLAALTVITCLMFSSCEVEDSGEYLLTQIPSSKSGIKFKNTLSEDIENNHLLNDMFVAGSGVAAGDVNKDGLIDLFFTGNQVDDKLYLNKGELKFKDVGKEAGILSDGLWSAGVTMADVNNDGWIDIYVCRSEQKNPQLSANLLYINQGYSDKDSFEVTFLEQAGEYGLADRGFSVQASFFDYNKDGFIDVYVVNQPPSFGKRSAGYYDRLTPETAQYTDRLYHNNGSGFFEDITRPANVMNMAYSLSVIVGDYNGDNWPDLYVTNDFNRPDHLYINQKDGSFLNTINQAAKHISNFSMGCDAADYNNDGYMDLMVVDMVAEDHKRNKLYMGGMEPEAFWQIVNYGWHYQYMFNTLQRNNGNGTFSDLAQLAGVSNTDWSWGPVFCDLDNDGYKDLFITNGIKRNQRHSDLNERITKRLDTLEARAEQQGKHLNDLIDVMEFVDMAPIDKIEDYVYRNNGDLTFKKMNGQWMRHQNTISHGVAYADLDNDGDQEIIINTIDDSPILYQNNAREQGNNYLRIEVINENGGPAYQAKVKLYKGDEMIQYAELTNARGYMSKSEDVLHFGLGKLKQVDKIELLFNSNLYVELVNIDANQQITVTEAQGRPYPGRKDFATPLFEEITEDTGLKYRHVENKYNDYKREVLLPHKMSQFGPGIAVGDVNGDGLEDFYIGAAAGSIGCLYIQNLDGSFLKKDQSSFKNDIDSEDLSSLFIDYDDDGDLDLYVASGGNEFEPEDPKLIDRLYQNNGRGVFSKTKEVLPELAISSSCIKSVDFDLDGDQDLFVGGRLIPGKYPNPASSFLLENQGGKFFDISDKVFPDLKNIGLVTDAEWIDYDDDGDMDLSIVGEWMSVRVYQNNEGQFIDVTDQLGIQGMTGWYYSVESSDLDKDGDQDLLIGNLGLNYKYKASEEEPFEVYSDDLDENGSQDIVLGYAEGGQLYPVRGKSCSSEQMPILNEKFKSYEAFSDADVFDIYGDALNEALNYSAVNFASLCLENIGGQEFKVHELPNEAQISNINDFIIGDFDSDDHLDIILAGNLYTSEIETPRNDAGMGLFLQGASNMKFTPVDILESGFFAPHDVRDLALIHLGSQKQPAILVANNDFKLQVIALASSFSN